MEDKDKTFMDVEFESGFDQELRDKEYRGVQLEELGKNPPNMFDALTDGIAVGIDHTIEWSMGQNIYAAAADLGLGSNEIITPEMAKQHFGLELDEDVSVEKAVILSEMRNQRIKNLQDLGRHTGFNAVVGFGGAMVGNMISPTAWLSGNVVARIAGTGAALAGSAAAQIGRAGKGLSNTAAYLKAAEALNKTKNFARPITSSATANRAAQLSKTLRSNIDRAMRPMRNAVTSPIGQAAVYNGIGNLMEELGVQAIEANKGYRYELGPMDIGFAIMAPAMLSGLAAAAKFSVGRAADAYKNAKEGKPNLKANEGIERQMVKEFLEENGTDYAKALKEAEAFSKQFPHRKMEFSKLKQDLDALLSPIGAVKSFISNMGDEGNLRLFIQDPTKFPEFGELPGSLKAKVQARSKDILDLHTVRDVVKTEIRYGTKTGKETGATMKLNEKTGDIHLRLPKDGLHGEITSRRAANRAAGAAELFDSLVERKLIQRVAPDKTVDPSSKAKEYIIPNAEKYIKRYSELTIKEAQAEQVRLDRVEGSKANQELSEVIDLLDEAIPSRLLSIQENKLATFKKTGMFLTKGTKELLIGTSPRELELAAAHINAFKTGKQIGSDDFKAIMKRAEEAGVVERKPRFDEGLESDVYEIKLTSNKMFSEEATELRDILASSSQKFREKIQNRLNKAPDFEKEVSLFDAIFRRGLGEGVKTMEARTGLSLGYGRGDKRTINILKDTEGKPGILQNFLNKSGAGHIKMADVINKLKEKGEVTETGTEFKMRIRIDAKANTMKPDGIAIVLDAIKVTDAVKDLAKIAEIERLKGSLSTPEPIKTDTLFGDLSGSPVKGQDTKMRVDLFKKSGMYISPKSKQLHIAVSKLKEAQKYFDAHGVKTNIEAKLQEMAKAGTINKPKRGPSGPNPVTKEGSYKGLYYSIPLKDSNYYRYGTARSIIKTDSSDQGLQDAISMIHENSTTLRDFTDSIKALGEDYKARGQDKAEQLGLGEIEALDELFKRFPESDIEEALFAARRTAVDFDSNAGIGDLIPQLRSLEALQAHIKDSAAKGKKDPSDLTLEEMLTVDVERVAKAIDDNKVNYDTTKKRYENTKPEVKSEITVEESLSRLDPELAKAVKAGLREFKSCALKGKGGKS